MARKNETVIADIKKEATAKGVDVPVTEGKSNADLEQILTSLKSMDDKAPAPPAPGADVKDDADKGDSNDDDDPEPDKKPAFPYVVAPGKSITAKGARILADGDEITKNDIPGDAFKAFLKSGHIKKG